MGRHPSGKVRWGVNVWVTPEERAELQRRLKERGLVPAVVTRRALFEAAGMEVPADEPDPDDTPDIP